MIHDERHSLYITKIQNEIAQQQQLVLFESVGLSDVDCWSQYHHRFQGFASYSRYVWFSKITKPLSSTISDDWHLRSRPCIQALVLPCQRSFFNISSSVHVGHAMPRPFYVLTRNTTIEPPPVRSNPGTSALARNFLQGTRLCDDIYSFVSLWIF